MTFDSSLIHTCTIQEATIEKDEFAEDIETWSDKYTGVVCRKVEKTVRYADEQKGLMIAKEDLLLVHADTDIVEGNRVADIAMRHDGSAIDAGPFEVLFVRRVFDGRGVHHLSVQLERIQ